jgi:hypothetical protein
MFCIFFDILAYGKGRVHTAKRVHIFCIFCFQIRRERFFLLFYMKVYL